MFKLFKSGIIAGIVLLVLSVSGLYLTVFLFPNLAEQYYDPAFNSQQSRVFIYYLHPFVISFALAWFWGRVKDVLTGSFLTRAIEFAVLYGASALLPIMWLIYSALNVSLEMVTTWFVFGLLQTLIAGLIFEKIDG